MAGRIHWEVVAWGRNTIDPIHYCKSKRAAEKLAEKLNNDPDYQPTTNPGEWYGAYVQCVDDDGIID